ncbi:unnamed protein product [Paramecium sonneborni]|uniref:H-type lectin domain-containing protein n=1 Tax=Paramecium sonneborni TaxID=65129 RepID=A0A8S1RHE3_9CILI|nr:unnamed protein product [Paramecium sonneborni]
MNFIVVFSAFSFVVSYIGIQYEAGSKQIMQAQAGHILENYQYLPRQIDVHILFQKTFDQPPEVFLSLKHFDLNYTNKNGFIEKASLITKQGFMLSGIAVSSSKLHELKVDWFAFQDDKVSVITYESSNYEELNTGSGERKIYLTIDHKLKYARYGIISLIGYIHLSKFLVEQIDSKQMIVSVRTYNTGLLQYVKMNILLGTDQSLWTSTARATIFNPYFAALNYQYTSRFMTFEIPSQIQRVGTIPIVTLRGYEFDTHQHPRIYYDSLTFNTNLNYNLVTWWDTVVHAVYDQCGIYIPVNTKILQSNCVELFSECDFNGDSFIICDQIPDLHQQGWNKPIKSFSIPAFRILYLFDKENYTGLKTKYIENQSCIDSIVALSAKFQPIISFIKILFLNTKITDNCSTVMFYSECNYLGQSIQIRQGYQLKPESKIPFQIKSIQICPNIIVKLKGASYFGGAIQVFTASQSCLDSYKFPKYIQPS